MTNLLNSSNFLSANGAPAIGLILRSGPALEQITVYKSDGKLAFLDAYLIPEDRFYASGRFVGMLDNLAIVSVAPTVLQLSEDIEVMHFTATGTPLPDQNLARVTVKQVGGKDTFTSVTVKPEDFAAPEEYQILFSAAMNAKGCARLPIIRPYAGADGIILPWLAPSYQVGDA